jgi:protocatechuate 3,4-dioxygenase beta subunit
MCAAATFSFFQGLYDVQYADRVVADCRGRLGTDKDGRYGYRAVVPVPYPIPGDVSVLLASASLAVDVLNPTSPCARALRCVGFSVTIRVRWASSF